MPVDNSLINLSKLSYCYQGSTSPVLDNISFSLQQGEYLAITGPSGSGKSTLLSILGLMQQGYSGQYLLCGADVAQLTHLSIANLKRYAIGLIFQNFNLLGHLTVYENICLALHYHREIKRASYRQHVMTALERVDMVEFAQRFPAQLSGGQQQRVAIARAVVTKPQLLLADEPTGNLDSTNSSKVMELLAQLHQAGTTICLITHDNNCAQQAKRIIQLQDGRIVQAL
jgi:putative ABC transport system ATP-binding protein